MKSKHDAVPVSELSKDDIDGCIMKIGEIQTLARKAREEGLLALDDSVSSLEPYIFQKGVQLVVDGTDPDLIEAIMDRLIDAGDYSGSSLLLRLIIKAGVLGIQSGDNPGVLASSLYAFLGEEKLEEMDKSAE